MPLVKAELAQGLTNILRANEKSGEIVASKIADTYQIYASKAVAGAALPVFTGLEKGKLLIPLQNALRSPEMGNPTVFANTIGMGITAFWTGVICSTPPILGSIVSVPGAAAGIALAATLLSNTANTQEKAGSDLATIMDTITKSAICIFTAPQIGLPPPATLV